MQRDEFAVQRSEASFAQVATDHAIEQSINRDIKLAALSSASANELELCTAGLWVLTIEWSKRASARKHLCARAVREASGDTRWKRTIYRITERRQWCRKHLCISWMLRIESICGRIRGALQSLLLDNYSTWSKDNLMAYSKGQKEMVEFLNNACSRMTWYFKCFIQLMVKDPYDCAASTKRRSNVLSTCSSVRSIFVFPTVSCSLRQISEDWRGALLGA